MDGDTNLYVVVRSITKGPYNLTNVEACAIYEYESFAWGHCQSLLIKQLKDPNNKVKDVVIFSNTKKMEINYTDNSSAIYQVTEAPTNFYSLNKDSQYMNLEYYSAEEATEYLKNNTKCVERGLRT